MKHMPKRDLLKQFIPVAVIATVAAVLLVTPSFAAKRPSAWVAVNSTTGATAGTNLVVGDNLVFSGCGYAANGNVSVVVVSPYATSFTGANVGSDGCFSTSTWGYTALETGSYTVKIYQSSDHHNPSASLTFDVS